MSGSIPLALDVTRSIGTAPVASGFSFLSAAIAARVASISFFEVGARFVPPVRANTRGADGLAADDEDRAVGLTGKDQLCDSGHGQRIDDPQQDHRDDRVDSGRSQVTQCAVVRAVLRRSGESNVDGLRTFHVGPYVRCNAVRMKSMSLIPIKGTTRPPRP